MTEEMKTFIEKPIVSYDGEDDKGIRAEVLVQKGLANIDDKKEKKSRDTVNFYFSSDNLKHPISTWVNKEWDKKIYDLLAEAYEEETPIYIRLEKKRKTNVERTEPIKEISKTMEIARDNVITIVAGVRLDEKDDWIESSESITLSDEDSLYAASANGGKGGIKATPRTIKSVQNNPFNGEIESPPYKTFNSDDTVNPGSDAVSAVTNTYTFVYDYLNSDKCEAKLSDDEETAKKQIFSVTNKVIVTANKAQVLIYDGKISKPMMSKRSHVRARSLIFHSMETVNKITQAELDDKEALNTWSEEILERVANMWKWSMSLTEKIESP